MPNRLIDLCIRPNYQAEQEWGRKMKLDFIPKFVMLLAGAIICIISIVNDMDTTYSLELLLGTLIVFYIIGLIAKKLIQKVMEGNMFVKRNSGGINMELPRNLDENIDDQPVQEENEALSEDL